MKISRKKLNIILARKQLQVSELAEVYGVSRERMHAILRQDVMSPKCAGRLAKALDVDVTEILEDEEVV